MASSFGGKVVNFRDTFKLGDKNTLRWFPGHMGKGIKQMEEKLRNVDCLIEVHDARVPVSGRYADFRKTLCNLKPHIFVLNKKDLADKTYIVPALNRLHDEGIKHVVLTNMKSQADKGATKIMPLMLKLISESDRFNRSQEKDYSVMIIGVPNVGKSSLINRLRNHHLGKAKAAHVGAVAGITRAVQCRIKISEDPLVYLLDTPGILPPNIIDINAGLKLALIGCTQDHLVGPQVMSDYLLFWLNKNHRLDYVEKLGLQGPTDDINEVLIQIAVKLKKIIKLKNFDGQLVTKPDLNFAAEHFLKCFRTGKLGQYCLDQDILRNK
ncbi:mitochondrial GTPase 1 isoform X1 [Copidosoma floridanum]|uniref:mitochondrial GTPase 1 isoform X1 n=1 Tax=Copidosoma floridanum TaxID=29053 RepID=UPI0006C9880E|nr:mitochondrial GTPase 1 isoform X1 [Copidosoma floridanum]